MPDNDDALANTALALNEDAKASRRKAKTAPVADADLAGDGPEDDEGDRPGWDNEGEHTTALERMENIAEELELDTGEMVEDVRDFLLDTIKARPKPWSATSQAEQRDVAAACENAAKELIRKIVEGVAANGTQAIRVLLTKVNMGSDIVISGKVKTFGDDEEDTAVLALHRSIGKFVMLTRATVEDFSAGGREAATDPDQNDFGFEGGGDEGDYD